MKLHLKDNLLKFHHTSCSRPPNTAKQNAHDESSKTLGNIFSLPSVFSVSSAFACSPTYHVARFSFFL